MEDQPTVESVTEAADATAEAAEATQVAAEATGASANAVAAAEPESTKSAIASSTEQLNDLVEQARSIDWAALADKGIALLIQIALAAVIFYVGKFIARRIETVVRATMTRRSIDPLLINFVSSILFYALMVLVVITALGQLGVKTTSFVAIVGAAGLAVGLALQGSLSNFASGVLIILFRPFSVGDFVTAGGESGIVESVTILTTELKSPDGKKIIIPNSSIMAGSITNVTAHPVRRVDMTFGIGYSDDIDRAKELIWEILKADERVLEDPGATVALAELGESSVNLVVRPWVEKANWWPVFTETQEKVKKAFDANGISIPFPQRDVHLFEATANT